MSKKGPIFIVGAGRSGTTLLRLMLHNHSQIAIPPESQILMEFYKIIPLFNDLKDPENCEKFINLFLTHPRIKAWGLHKSDILNLKEKIGFRDIISTIYQSFANKEAKSRWGEKTPKYIHQVGQLIKIFPNCKIIHLIRDGRDVIASQLKSFHRYHFYTSALNWNKIMTINEKLQSDPDHFMNVHYENLIQNPKDTLKNICQFINESFEEKMLDFHSSSAASKTTEDEKHHHHVTQPISASYIGKYKNDLATHQTKLIESVCHHYLVKNKYFIENPELIHIPFYHKWYYQACSLIKMTVHYSQLCLKRLMNKEILYTIKFNIYKLRAYFIV